jgi:hypothetical protein
MMKMISTKIKVTSIFIFEWISVVGLATYEYCCKSLDQMTLLISCASWK